MICPFGRQFDQHHATCISCQRQGVVCQKPKKAKLADTIRTWHVGQVLMTTAYMPSSNHWHGRPRHVYLAERKKWEMILSGTWALWGVQSSAGKRVLTVRRFVHDQRGLIADGDNRSAAIKPLKDTLVKFGVLRNDTDDDVMFTVEQEIDKNNPRVEIEIHDASQ